MTNVTVTQEDRKLRKAIMKHIVETLNRPYSDGDMRDDRQVALDLLIARHRQSSTEEVERAIIWHLLRDGRDVLRSEFLEAEGWHLEAAFDGMIRAGIILPSFPNSSRANSGLQHWSLAMVHPDTALAGVKPHE